MSKQNFILLLVFLSFLQFGCGNQTAKNRNARAFEEYNQAKKRHTNPQNANVNEADSPANEVVETFTDATEALKKADEYLESNQTSNAIDVLKQAIELDPDLALAHLRLSVAYSAKEKEDELKPITEETAKLKKKRSTKAAENAVKAFKKLIRKNPDDDVALFNIGRSYSRLFDDANSEKSFSKAVKLKPEDGEYQTEYGASLIKLAKYSRAIKALNKALEIDEENFRAEDLLKKAKEGRRRVGFKSKKKRETTKTKSKNQQKKETKSEKKPDTTKKSKPSKPEKKVNPSKKGN